MSSHEEESPRWAKVDPETLERQADEAWKRRDGVVLVKRYDASYRYLKVGKWVLFGSDGTCLGHLHFREEIKTPFRWADQKVKDEEIVKTLRG